MTGPRARESALDRLSEETATSCPVLRPVSRIRVAAGIFCIGLSIVLRITGAFVIASQAGSVEGVGLGAGIYGTGKAVFYLGILLCGKPAYLRLKALLRGIFRRNGP